jgi:hypothetical protein
VEENLRAVAVQMLADLQARPGSVEQVRQLALAYLDRRRAQVLAVKLKPALVAHHQLRRR